MGGKSQELQCEKELTRGAECEYDAEPRPDCPETPGCPRQVPWVPTVRARATLGENTVRRTPSLIRLTYRGGLECVVNALYEGRSSSGGVLWAWTLVEILGTPDRNVRRSPGPWTLQDGAWTYPPGYCARCGRELDRKGTEFPGWYDTVSPTKNPLQEEP